MKNIWLYTMLALAIVCVFNTELLCQATINEANLPAHASAQLEVQSLTKGLLMPSMTQSERLSIPAPGNGLFLFQTDNTPGFQYNEGSPGEPNWNRVAGVNEILLSETRTPLDSLDLDGNGSLIITEPGHYFLRENMIVTQDNGDGITIDSDNVTIDLNGYAVIAGPQSTDDGIRVLGDHNNITIKNGMVTGFGEDGINGIFASQSTFRNLMTKDNGESGLVADWSCLVVNCVATNNGIHGIDIDDGSIMRDCVVSFNGDDGIRGSQGSLIYNCTSSNNQEDGIDVDDASRVENCTSFDNVGHGIDLSVGGAGINNTVYRNGWNGLDLGSNCMAMNNVSNDNGQCIASGTCDIGPNGQGSGVNRGAGIRVFNNANVINNQCNGNYFGIAVLSTDTSVTGNNVQNNSHAGIICRSDGSMFVKNMAHNNGFSQAPGITNTNLFPLGNLVFSSNADPTYGPIIDVSTAGEIILSSVQHPFANFIY